MKYSNLQKLVELVDILWAGKLIVVEVVNNGGDGGQEDELEKKHTSTVTRFNRHLQVTKSKSTCMMVVKFQLQNEYYLL